MNWEASTDDTEGRAKPDGVLATFSDRDYLRAVLNVLVSLSRRHFGETFRFRVTNAKGDFVILDTALDTVREDGRDVDWSRVA